MLKLIQLIAKVDHLLNTHARVSNIRVVHAQNREILDNLVIKVVVVVFSDSLNILIVKQYFLNRLLKLLGLLDL